MDWAEAEAMLDASVASVFDGQHFTVRPRRSGVGVNAKRVDDPERAAFEFSGSLEMGSASQGQRSIDPGARQTLPQHEAVITALDDGWPYVPRKDDILVEAQSWVIADIARDGTRRRVFFVNRIERQGA